MPKLPEPKELIEPIWEQQPDEHKNHYIWFTMYCSVKPHERTYQTGWKLLTVGTNREGLPASDYYKKTGRIWRWIERAAAKDFHEAMTDQARWISRDKDRREKAYVVGGKLITQAERVLNKIESLPDDQLKVSLSEAKDVAVSGTQLQEAAIPSMQLAVDQMQWLLSSLSQDKRLEVMEKLKLARNGNAGLLTAKAISEDEIEAEYSDVTNDNTEEEIF